MNISFLRFYHTSRRHNASIFSIYLGKSSLNPNTKVQKICDNGVPYHRFYFDLQFNTSILFRLRHSDSFSKLIHFLSESAYVWNSVYVEAESFLRVLFERATPPPLRATSPIFCVAKHPVMLRDTAEEEFCDTLFSWGFAGRDRKYFACSFCPVLALCYLWGK